MKRKEKTHHVKFTLTTFKAIKEQMFAVFRGCFVQLDAVNGDNGVSGRAFIVPDHGGRGKKSLNTQRKNNHENPQS